MATYLELKAQAEALAQQAEEARLAELDGIIGAMRAQIAEYGITAEQLFGRRRSTSSAKGTQVGAKYRDPKTGAQWSGRGKRP
ncbi:MULTISPECIES: H-NS histone family protein [Serratia]|uniref:H-NS histone family protein n=2 Tax=Serratia TaxID=613 RepID=UPI000B5E99FE|nr:H-NS histone [Serratia marcescens]AYU89952.1 H-NS histone family protein [Serratia sp. LS-1]MBH2554013.1 H-NS histone family protein [Serratia ureilytica]MBH2559326.1 H-NS histone family protein [Serratia ureilytica]MBH2946993.1 H-NS histone family protein [Serratia ureilytica]